MPICARVARTFSRRRRVDRQHPVDVRRLVAERPDPRVLDGVEDSGVGVFLHLADRGDQLRIPDGHADPPARHVVGLGEGVELDAHLLRPVGGQEAEPLLAVEDHLAVGVVVADGDVVRLREGDQPVEELPGCAGAGRVVRVIEEHPPRLFHDLRRNLLEHRKVGVLRADRNIVGNPAPHEDARPVGGIAGIGHQDDVAGIDPGQDEVVAPLLGADQAQDLRRRIQRHAVAGLVPAGDLLPEGEHPLLLIRRIAVVLRVARRPAELVDDRIGRRLHRVADREADHIHAVGLGLGDLLPQLHEQVGRDLRQTVGNLQRVYSPFELIFTWLFPKPHPRVFPDKPPWSFLQDKLS